MTDTRPIAPTTAVAMAILGAAGFLLAGDRGPASPASASRDDHAALAALAVAPEGPLAGYRRGRFPHWTARGGACDTREVVLRRQGVDVVTDGACRAVSGRWASPYDGVVVTDASRLDIDHTVALAEAWRSGADRWTDERRRAFANDLAGPQLLAVTAGSNRSKGDQDAAEWRPPSEAHWCVYARSVVVVKATYGLTVDPAERDALAAMLDRCRE